MEWICYDDWESNHFDIDIGIGIGADTTIIPKKNPWEQTPLNACEKRKTFLKDI